MDSPVLTTTFFPVRYYALGETLQSGQAFRWRSIKGGWEAVVHNRWVRLEQLRNGIQATVVSPGNDWGWLRDYLQIDVDLKAVLASFPNDAPMRTAVESCRGLRLLRQPPWECLASFILSSTKQIVQIQQIVEMLCHRFGAPVPVPPGHPPAWAFPSASVLAGLSEQDLRCCKMGFRAPYLKATATQVASGEIDLEAIRLLHVNQARARLVDLPGVGRKIADCVLLFAYGFPTAFPIDVWVLKALRQLYFPGRRKSMKKLIEFSQKHFGPNAGFAQQYLFHHMRMQPKKK